MYINLMKEIDESNLTLEDISNEVGIPKNDLIKKINGELEFNLHDVEVILKIFNNYSFDYLFKK